MGKQALIDVLIVLVVPGILALGYYFWKGGSAGSLSFVSFTTQALPGDERNDLGAKVKVALDELNAIHFDQSIFDDPAYLSLEDFTPEVATSSIGREYPFSPPDVILEMVRTSRLQAGGSTKKPPATTNPAAKIDILKSGSGAKK